MKTDWMERLMLGALVILCLSLSALVWYLILGSWFGWPIPD